jgi:hypothetical protein
MLFLLLRISTAKDAIHIDNFTSELAFFASVAIRTSAAYKRQESSAAVPTRSNFTAKRSKSSLGC